MTIDAEKGAVIDLKAVEDGSEKEKTEVESQQVDSRNESKVDVPQAPPPFPDGGLQAWLTVAGAFLVQYATFGYIGAFGVYQDYYVREYLTNYSPSDIGWIGGMQIFLNFSLGIFAGKLFDKGYFYHLIVTSTFLNAIALFMLSLSKENMYYQVFLTNGVALGASSGLSYVPTLSIVSHYFQRKRSVAIGIVASGSALGSVLNPIMLNRLLRNPKIGFHNGVRISAGLNLFLMLVALAIMRTRLPPRNSGTPPIKEWLKQPAYVFHLFSGIFTFLGLFFPLFYLQLKAIKEGVDPSFAFYALSLINAASVFGRTIPNSLAPKFGALNLLLGTTFCTGVITICMAAVKDVAGTAVFALVYGFFQGGIVGLFPATIPLLSKDMSEVGARLGFLFGVNGILGLFATPIAGALLTSDYEWINASLFAGIALIVSSFVLVGSRREIIKIKGTQIL